MSGIRGILLAAGQSRRFGDNKLLQPLEDGLPMVVHSARRLKAALSDSMAIVKSDDEETAAWLAAEGLEVVINPDAEKGMGSSIACGVHTHPQADGWLIALADMPCLQIRTIRTVAAGIRTPRCLCAPVYNGQRGHPVGFGRAYLSDLLQLDGDEGARRIITNHLSELVLFESNDPGVIVDVDYPGSIHPATCRML